MILNDIKIAVRHLLRNRVYSLLNILGLACGIAAFLLIYLHVVDELSFDSSFPDTTSIFRITTAGENSEMFAECPEPIAELCAQSSDIATTARFKSILGVVVKAPNELFLERNAAYIDSSFFDIFTVPFVNSSKRHIFQEPHHILISDETALKYFGHTNVIGATVELQNQRWTISGVYEHFPQNSHLPQLDLLLPYSKQDNLNNWDQWTPTFIKLFNKNKRQNVEEWLTLILSPYHVHGKDYPHKHVLQPIRDIHLGSAFVGEYAKIGSRQQLFILSSIAALFLIIACVNSINLSLAQISARFNEIGVRKIIGALRTHLVRQFLFELSLLFIISMCLATFLVEVALPSFNHLIDKNLTLSFSNPVYWMLLVLTFVLITLIAGIYPALRFAAYRPLSILHGKGQLPAISHSFNMRSVLVVFQFVISISLIICSVVIIQQMNFIKSKDLGFQGDRLLVIPTQTQKMAQQLKTDFETIKQKFLQHHNIESATAHLASPGRVWRMDWPTLVETNFAPEFPFTWEFVDFDFINTYQLDILYGRNFNRNSAADRGRTFIINEAATKNLGFQSPERALGNHISTWMGEGEIIGVIRDFHYQSLHQKIDPLMLSVMPNFFPESTTLKLGNGDISQTLAFLEREWHIIFPDFPFEYYFVDEDFDTNYSTDKKFAITIYIFAILAIFVACLGLFGIASFSAIRRTKEIGVRKVLGATVIKIAGLLCKEVTGWIAVANLLAWPIAWIAAQKWLGTFAYHIRIDWQVFIVSGLFVLVISLLTVSLQTIKAAATNPVESLRYE